MEWSILVEKRSKNDQSYSYQHIFSLLGSNLLTKLSTITNKVINSHC